MKNKLFWLPALLLLQSCAVAGGIFKAGVWVGILVVVIIIVVIFMAVARRK
jgi:hypothetical protein